MLTNYNETPQRGSMYLAQGNTLGNKRPIIFALKGQKICCIREVGSVSFSTHNIFHALLSPELISLPQPLQMC